MKSTPPRTRISPGKSSPFHAGDEDETNNEKNERKEKEETTLETRR